MRETQWAVMFVLILAAIGLFVGGIYYESTRTVLCGIGTLFIAALVSPKSSINQASE